MCKCIYELHEYCFKLNISYLQSYYRKSQKAYSFFGKVFGLAPHLGKKSASQKFSW